MQNPKVPVNVSVYVAESWTEEKMQKIIKRAGTPKRIYCGQRVQGHTTVFTWDPAGIERPFYVKRRNAAQGVTRLFEKSLKQSDVEGIRFLPEIESTKSLHFPTWDKWRLTSAFILASTRRELAPSPGGHKSDLELVPLHGFLGSPRIDAVAAQFGLTRDQWLRTKYLPKLADYFAKLHFKLGFYTESHTQNLLLEFDKTTGEIKNFVVRDFYGMLPDYLKLMTEKRIEIGEPKNGFGLNLILNDNSLKGVNYHDAAKPGVNFGSYSLQSVVSMEIDPVKKMEYAEIFLKEYITKAGVIAGKPIKLSESGKDVLAWFQRKNPDSASFGSLYTAKQGILNSAVTEIMQDVHENVTKALAITMKPNESLGAQKAIGAAYRRSVSAGIKRAFSSTIESDLENSGEAPVRKFSYDGDRIYILDQENRVIGATFGIKKKQKAQLDKLNLATNIDLLCPQRFSRLRPSN